MVQNSCFLKCHASFLVQSDFVRRLLQSDQNLFYHKTNNWINTKKFTTCIRIKDQSKCLSIRKVKRARGSFYIIASGLAHSDFLGIPSMDNLFFLSVNVDKFNLVVCIHFYEFKVIIMTIFRNFISM